MYYIYILCFLLKDVAPPSACACALESFTLARTSERSLDDFLVETSGGLLKHGLRHGPAPILTSFFGFEKISMCQQAGVLGWNELPDQAITVKDPG